MVRFRTNRKTQRPFIITTVTRPFSRGDPRYGPVVAESRYNRATGEMQLTSGSLPGSNAHEIGHLMLARFAERHSRKELEDILRPLIKEHRHAAIWYTNTYYRDNLDEAVAETFAARKFGWENTDLGFDPEVVTPKIWALVNRVIKEELGK